MGSSVARRLFTGGTQRSVAAWFGLVPDDNTESGRSRGRGYRLIEYWGGGDFKKVIYCT